MTTGRSTRAGGRKAGRPILVRMPRPAAIALLRRFQALCPGFEAPVVANGSYAGEGSPIRAGRREPDAAAPATAGIGSGTGRGDVVREVAAGLGWRLLRTIPASRPRQQSAGTRVATGLPERQDMRHGGE